MERRRQVCFVLKEVGNLIRRKIDRERKKECNNECMGRTAIQRWIIDFIFTNRDKDIFQKDLEKEFSIRRSTATSVLKKMEKKGMIVRSPSEHDARLKKIQLTPQSAENYIEIRKTIEEFEKTIIEGIS
ncbi:MAG: MarR family transcriptional regulator [Clostridia bacterium]|jgi:DNA-binding MarR family transcriptional regulator|nr:MarR family transcriptional regulator [Clostridia bacterium]MCI2015893.1 MarR family transcriptional regulator [Clostridia bacterium]